MSKFTGALSGRWRSRRGVASALIILLLVLLIFFGVLSLVTTAADLRLACWTRCWRLPRTSRTIKLIRKMTRCA